MNLAAVLDDEILPRVEKPSRYLGNELNSVHKDPAGLEVRMVLAFPDLYDLGLGNLGIHILYAAVNALPYAWCERTYAPAADLEGELRARGLPLFALESREPLHTFDLLGITLQSELTYTNILNLLDLGGIPIRSVDRTDAHPLVCAGGPAVFNPEPIAPFIDFFVIGDGEDVILEITEVLRKLRGRPRKAKLLALSLLEGVYVPALYPFETTPEGRILPKVGAPVIRKRVKRDLDGATFPVNYIVPFTQQVHDRVSLEVLRGCTQGCRFCQAGMVTRPVRERSLEKIDELLQRTLDATGYEEVSLVSLSTCDYSRVRQLVENTVATARPRRVSVALPSLRLDSYSVELADMVAETRRTGLTVAPEAASPRLRQVINKWIPDEGLLDMAKGAFERGWDHIKLYFMIGLPTERDEDIQAIADLANRAAMLGRPYRGKVHTGVSTFVPKPFTPFQWAAQIGLAETVRRQDVLIAELRRLNATGVKFGRHDPEETFLEGLVSRADRRAADVIELAWRKGARFDAWREHLRFDLWMAAVKELNYDVEDALRERALDERFPWDHIDVLVDREWLAADWLRASELKHAPDCRAKKCHQCGVIDEERELCAAMLKRQIRGRKQEQTWVRKESPPAVEPDPVQRLWLRISRTGSARMLSHLESMNAWARALRRAKAPLAFSQGFHPHPRIAFSAALPHGEQSAGEYLDVTLVARVDPAAFLQDFQGRLPDGFGAHAIAEVPMNAPSLMSLAAGAEYTLFLPGEDRERLAARIAEILAAERLPVARKTKADRALEKRGRTSVSEVDIRPMLRELTLREGGDVPTLDLVVCTHEGKSAKPRDVAALLGADPERVRVYKRDTLMLREGRYTSITEGWGAAMTAAAPGGADSPAPSC